MVDPLGGVGGNDFPQIQLSPKAAEEPTRPPMLGALDNRNLVRRANANVPSKALAAKTAARAKAEKMKDKPAIAGDAAPAPNGNAVRQQNARRILRATVDTIRRTALEIHHRRKNRPMKFPVL
jgi:hypothetical protein